MRIEESCYKIGQVVLEQSIKIENEEIKKLQTAVTNANEKLKKIQIEKENSDKELYELEETVRNMNGKTGCPNCGRVYEKKKELLFCPKCGTSLKN